MKMNIRVTVCYLLYVIQLSVPVFGLFFNSQQNTGFFRNIFGRNRNRNNNDNGPIPPTSPASGIFNIRFPDRTLQNNQYMSLRSHAKSDIMTSPECVFPTVKCDNKERYRRPDGYCNNINNPAWGTPGWPFKRIIKPAYQDGSGQPRSFGVRGGQLPSARLVSRVVHTADSDKKRDDELSALFTHFGQFVDHDVDLTPLKSTDSELDCCDETMQPLVRGFLDQPLIVPFKAKSLKSHPLPGTCFPIPIPEGDTHFNKTCMNFVRSKIFSPSFKCMSKHREQGNIITSFMDASQVYGSSQDQQNRLRESASGRLRSHRSDLLPANATTSCLSSTIKGKVCFGAGDARVNEQPALSAIHVVFHRYHNHLVDTLTGSYYIYRNNDELAFQTVRKIIGALMQQITYDEYLPLLLGETYMAAYGLKKEFIHRYEPNTDPRIMNSFATAAFRFGHSMVPGHLMFGRKELPTVRKLKLETAFFCPHMIQDSAKKNLDEIMEGTLSDFSQGSDRFFSRALTDKLFENNKRSLDLAALNIQRGRDHGLPAYNDFREMCGLPRVTSLPGAPLLEVYDHIDDVDLFTGALSEDHVEGGVVGPTFAGIIARQFRDLKYGDRFWYETPDRYTGFTRDQLQAIRRVSLASIICTVTNIAKVQRLPMKVAHPSRNPEIACGNVPTLDLSPWMRPI